MSSELTLSSRRWRRCAVLTATITYLNLLLGVAPAQARVTPLAPIIKQIVKPNVVVMLDTSGSMAGVPGGQTLYSAEAGVDCDNGEACRLTTGGRCQAVQDNGAPRLCGNDQDCRMGRCEFGDGLCSQDGDCPGTMSACEYGTCSVSGTLCAATLPCPGTETCTRATCVDASQCNPVYGTCDRVHPDTQCLLNEDCPLPNKGTCAGNPPPPAGFCLVGSTDPSYKCPPGPKTCALYPTQTCTADTDCNLRFCGIEETNICSDTVPCPPTGVCRGVTPPQSCAADLECPCVPQCTGKICGPNGCGGECGTCPTNYDCNWAGTACVYVCPRDCSGKSCGPDGCGGSCGTCPVGKTCNTTTGACESTCTPSCAGRVCGSDGCSGSCGTCSTGACNDATGQCTCTPNCAPGTCGGGDGCGGSCGCPAGLTCQGGSCVSCSPSCAGRQCGPNGCGGSCGTCTTGVCNTSTGLCDCTPNCMGRACGPDPVCGSSCGTCPAGKTCNTTTGTCVSSCTPSCAGKECGSDGCMGSCGTCPSGKSCINGQCCTNDCGTRQCGVPPDACAGVNCGTCPTGQTCNSAGQCVCNANCGSRVCGPDPNCGTNCGTCPAGKSCNSSGQCVCNPNCAGKQCGPDGCGGECGTCTGSTSCNSSGQCVCVPDCDGRECGPNGCGGSCGSCGPGMLCAGGTCEERLPPPDLIRLPPARQPPRDPTLLDPHQNTPTGPPPGAGQARAPGKAAGSKAKGAEPPAATPVQKGAARVAASLSWAEEPARSQAPAGGLTGDPLTGEGAPTVLAIGSGHCLNNPTWTCAADTDCQKRCTNYPSEVCTADSQCGRCSNHATTECTGDSQCGRCSSGGTCSGSGTTCTENWQCPAGQTCSVACTSDSQCVRRCKNPSVPSWSGEPCSADSQCQTCWRSKTCQSSGVGNGSWCSPDAPEGEPCDFSGPGGSALGGCVVKTCGGSAASCSGGRCPPKCTDPSGTCPAWAADYSACGSGYCLRSACSNDEGCGGTCASGPLAGTACTADGQCGSGTCTKQNAAGSNLACTSDGNCGQCVNNAAIGCATGWDCAVGTAAGKCTKTGAACAQGSTCGYCQRNPTQTCGLIWQNDPACGSNRCSNWPYGYCSNALDCGGGQCLYERHCSFWPEGDPAADGACDGRTDGQPCHWSGATPNGWCWPKACATDADCAQKVCSHNGTACDKAADCGAGVCQLKRAAGTDITCADSAGTNTGDRQCGVCLDQWGGTTSTGCYYYVGGGTQTSWDCGGTGIYTQTNVTGCAQGANGGYCGNYGSYVCSAGAAYNAECRNAAAQVGTTTCGPGGSGTCYAASCSVLGGQDTACGYKKCFGGFGSSWDDATGMCNEQSDCGLSGSCIVGTPNAGTSCLRDAACGRGVCPVGSSANAGGACTQDSACNAGGTGVCENAPAGATCTSSGAFWDGDTSCGKCFTCTAGAAFNKDCNAIGDACGGTGVCQLDQSRGCSNGWHCGAEGKCTTTGQSCTVGSGCGRCDSPYSSTFCSLVGSPDPACTFGTKRCSNQKTWGCDPSFIPRDCGGGRCSINLYCNYYSTTLPLDPVGKSACDGRTESQACHWNGGLPDGWCEKQPCELNSDCAAKVCSNNPSQVCTTNAECGGVGTCARSRVHDAGSGLTVSCTGAGADTTCGVCENNAAIGCSWTGSTAKTWECSGNAAGTDGICPNTGATCTKGSSCGYCANNTALACNPALGNDPACGQKKCGTVWNAGNANCTIDTDCNGKCKNNSTLACSEDSQCGGAVCALGSSTPGSLCTVDSGCNAGGAGQCIGMNLARATGSTCTADSQCGTCASNANQGCKDGWDCNSAGTCAPYVTNGADKSCTKGQTCGKCPTGNGYAGYKCFNIGSPDPACSGGTQVCSNNLSTTCDPADPASTCGGGSCAAALACDNPSLTQLKCHISGAVCTTLNASCGAGGTCLDMGMPAKRALCKGMTVNQKCDRYWTGTTWWDVYCYNEAGGQPCFDHTGCQAKICENIATPTLCDSNGDGNVSPQEVWANCGGGRCMYNTGAGAELTCGQHYDCGVCRAWDGTSWGAILIPTQGCQSDSQCPAGNACYRPNNPAIHPCTIHPNRECVPAATQCNTNRFCTYPTCNQGSGTSQACVPTETCNVGSGVASCSMPQRCEASTNYARGSRAFMSSLLNNDYNYAPYFVFDRNQGTFPHTNLETNPWIAVDLGTARLADTIRIWNMYNPTRLTNYTLQVDPTDCNFDGDSTTVATNLGTANPGTFQDHSFVSRLVRCYRLRLNGTNYLHPAEVTLFSAGVFVGGPIATQSSTWTPSANYHAHQAIDGSIATMTHTDNNANAWWQVDFNNPIANVDTIKIWNGENPGFTSRVSDFKVRVDPTDCLFDGDSAVVVDEPGQAQHPSKYSWTPRTVRCLRIQLDGTNYMHLGHVEVLAANCGAAGTNPCLAPPCSSATCGPRYACTADASNLNSCNLPYNCAAPANSCTSPHTCNYLTCISDGTCQADNACALGPDNGGECVYASKCGAPAGDCNFASVSNKCKAPTCNSEGCQPRGRCADLGSNSCAYPNTCSAPAGACQGTHQCQPDLCLGGSCNPANSCNTGVGTCSLPAQCAPTTAGSCKSNETCDTANTCPSALCQGGTCGFGLCRYDRCNLGGICDGEQTCKAPVNKGPCVVPADPCGVPPPLAPKCVGAKLNRCITGSSTGNRCILPTPPNDTCVQSGVPRRIKMCRLAETVCTADTDCLAVPGDSCGPATSRAVVAKRVIKSVVLQNYSIVNFGLMSWYQTGYFPYFPNVGDAGTSGPAERFFTRAELEALSPARFTEAAGPTASFSVGGDAYTLRASSNSRYRVNTGPGGFLSLDQSWNGTSCGAICTTPSGSGAYEGSYYSYTRKNRYCTLSNTECNTDLECDPGEANDHCPGARRHGRCSVTTTRLCVGDPDCPATQTCVLPPAGLEDTRRCQPATCASSADCLGGQTCTAGKCQTASNKPCRNDADCPGRESCPPIHLTPPDAGFSTKYKTGATYYNPPRGQYQGYCRLDHKACNFNSHCLDPAQNPCVRPGDYGPLTFMKNTGASGTCPSNGACGATCGAQSWVSIDPTGVLAATKASEISDRLRKAAYGGISVFEATPAGCGLLNEAYAVTDTSAAAAGASAYHYMKATRQADQVTIAGTPTTHPCRPSYVLLVTDGDVNGPGDTAGPTPPAGTAPYDYVCDDPRCAPTGAGTCRLSGQSCTSHEDCATGNANPAHNNAAANLCVPPDPAANGCTCRAVNASWKLLKDLAVRTLVIGFGGDVQNGRQATINDYIAKNGGTDNGAAPGYAYRAKDEAELTRSMQLAIFDAARGSYPTSQASSSSGTQATDADGNLSVTAAHGNIVFDAYADFPAWSGHLVASEVACAGSTCGVSRLWDTADYLTYNSAGMNAVSNRGWWDRVVFTSDSSNNLVRIKIDRDTSVSPPTFSMTSTTRAKLLALGLGTSDAEVERVARWLLGDPTMGNPAVLGAVINSTPTEVGGALIQKDLTGSMAFFDQYKTRPSLTYYGASDGLLHAAYTRPVGTFKAGDEAFAFLSPTLIPAVRKVFTQGGQMPNPDQHVFGLANSAKAKNICVASGSDPADICANGATADNWHTVLAVGEGFGGPELFVLDITDPFSDWATGAIKTAEDTRFGINWHTAYGANAGTFDQHLGETISVPGFFLKKSSNMDDFRLVFASGYKDGPDGTNGQFRGWSMVTADVNRGGTIDRPEHRISSRPNSCTQEYALLTDAGTARTFAAGQNMELLSAYAGDTWGNLWRIRPGDSNSAPVQVLGAGLDLAGSGGETGLGCQHPLHFMPAVVQLDRDPGAANQTHQGEVYLVQVTNSWLDPETESFAEPSKLVIIRDKPATDGRDMTFGSSSTTGRIEVSADQLCAAMAANGTCTTPMPSRARPTATPMVVLKGSGTGFLVFSMWYVPHELGCDPGSTYLAVHDVDVTSTVAPTQTEGLKVADAPRVSATIANKRVVVVGGGTATDITGNLRSGLTFSGAPGTQGTDAEKYKSVGWDELP